MFLEPGADVLESFADLLSRHARVFAIISPPRCSSTAFARVLWQQPSVRFYCHEPFETTYYLADGLEAVQRKLAAPLDLARLSTTATDATALLIKEMPYQVGSNFPLLAAAAGPPLVFLMRDPRLSIASRMKKKTEVGDNPSFPKIESGWELWREQIAWCESRGLEHILVDSTDFRNYPEAVLPQVCERLELPFSPAMLEWTACPEVELDNLGGRHRHLYGAVLESTGILRQTSEPPPIESFPREDGWREHVERCLAIYRDMSSADARIQPDNVSPAPG